MVWKHGVAPPPDAWVWAHVRGECCASDGRRREVGTEVRKDREGGIERERKRKRDRREGEGIEGERRKGRRGNGAIGGEAGEE
jgi:hypothetical protein